jgi:RNA polymerase sigma-70 factor (ECF subfamily)
MRRMVKQVVGRPTNIGEPATTVDAEFGAGHAPAESRVDAAEHSPDGELIRRMQADDLDAFELFFARHRNVIHRTAYGLTGDRQAAEEVLQDTFARAWQRRTTLLLNISPVPWLHRVALNLCYSRLGRRRLRSEPIEDSMAGMLRDAAAEPDERAERQELRSIVRDGVAGLPPKHQSVIVLYYLHGMSLQETAELLGVRLGTVKSRLHYALRSLRTRLEADRRFGGAYRPEEDLVLLEREIGA